MEPREDAQEASVLLMRLKVIENVSIALSLGFYLAPGLLVSWAYSEFFHVVWLRQVLVLLVAIWSVAGIFLILPVRNAVESYLEKVVR